MKIRTLVVPFFALLQTLSAHAENDTDMDQLLSLSLEQLMATKVSISTSTKQALSKAPSVVSVITADDIKATGATNLTDILQSVPGIYIRANLFGFRPLVTFRGASSASTLLMINGAPIKDMVWASGIFWKGLPTNMIDRVEIIRGPGSALYGSDAAGGVINVITKTAGKIDHSEAGIRTGSFDTQAGWMQHGTNWNGFDIGITAEVSHTNGHNPHIAADGQTATDKKGPNPPVSSAPGNANFGWDNQDIRLSVARDHWRLHADFMRHDNVAIGLTGAAVLDPLTRGSDNRYNFDLLYDNAEFAKDWGLNGELRYLNLDYTSGDGFQERPPGYQNNAYPNGELNLQRSAERRLSFEGSGLYTGWQNHSIRIGSGAVSQNLYLVEQYVNFGTGPNGAPLPAGGPLVNLSDTPYAFAPEKTRRIGYVFAQDEWSFANDWALTAGARYDHYSDFGGTLNPRLALVWQSTEKLTTKLMYGQAFRAPSYLELYSNTSATVGNANLKPERSRTLDMAFSYAASRDLTLGLDLYRFAQYDVIGSDPSVTPSPYKNIGDLTAHGIELEAQWQASKAVRVSGNLTARAEEYSAVRSFNVPKRKAYLRTDWAFLPDWNWDVQANWIGEHIIPLTSPNNAPIGAYTLVDTTLRYAYDKHWEFAGSVRNLFDTDAREYASKSLPDNLPLPRRSVYAEVRYKF
jgi:iron complex outermembrane receptor protein